MSTSINNTIVCNEPHASLDSYYGPYNSVEDALNLLNDVVIAGITYHKRHVGLTIGVWNANKTDITEYWFKGGIGDNCLIEKTNGGGGGLPGNICIITFDRNGGSGVQNSLLTDSDGQVLMPEPSIEFTGKSFAGWKYGTVTYQPRDVMTVNTNVTVQAQWSGTTEKYTVAWTNKTGLTITGTANGSTINNGTQVESGSTIVLTADYDAAAYGFDRWTGVPNTVDPTHNPIQFTLDTNYESISASVSAKPVEQYKVSWNGDEGILAIGGVLDEEKITSPYTVDKDGVVKLTIESVKDGYQFASWTWEGKPDNGEYTIDGETITFRVTGPVNMAAISKKTANEYISYYGDAEGGIATEVEDFVKVDANSVDIDIKEKGIKSLYVIIPDGYIPECEMIDLIPINNYKEQYNTYVEKGWIMPNTNTTAGDLKEYGDVMYAYVGEKIEGNTITVSIKHS